MNGAINTFLDRAQQVGGDIHQRAVNAFAGPGAVDANIQGLKDGVVKRVQSFGAAIGIDAHRQKSIEDMIKSLGK
ncbi:MAG: hypothetical protein RMA76_34380 [Deltaproteobacteria bacterium]|jgi:hypothetical protein